MRRAFTALLILLVPALASAQFNRLTPQSHAVLHETDPNLLVIPEYSDPYTNQPAIEFRTRGAYDNGSWFIMDADNFALHEEDHVLAIVYNSRWSPALGWTKPVPDSHWVRMGFESRFLFEGDPLVKRGYFEWNMDIDAKTGSTTPTDVKRPWGFVYDMDAMRTELGVGDPTDPNSAFFYMGSGHGFWANVDVIRFADRSIAGKNMISTTTQGRIILDPGGRANGADHAVMIRNMSGDLDITSGVKSDGVTAGRMFLGRNRPVRVVVGSEPYTHQRFMIDGQNDEIQFRIRGNTTQSMQLMAIERNDGTDLVTVSGTGQLGLSGLGVELNESDANPPCAAGNYNLYADASETRVKVCNNGARVDVGGSANLSDPYTYAGAWTFSGSARVPTSTTAPAGDCDAAVEAGRIYHDSDAAAGSQFLVCSGVGGWVVMGSGAYLPLVGGTMTGTITGFSTVGNGDVLVLPACADDPNCQVAAIRFDTKGPYDNGSWFITAGSADDGPTDGQSNHPFAIHYNSRVLDDHGQRRILDGSHVINMGFESRFPFAADPNVVRGLFEWNLDIDPRINVGDPANISYRRPFALHYDMDVGKTTFAVGLGSDPNSGFFQFGTGFNLFANNSGFRFGDRADAGSDPQDPNAPGMINLDPGCIMPSNWAPRIANCFGGLTIDAGRNTLGVIERTYFSRNTSGETGSSFVFGNSAFDPGWVIIDGARDTVQLRVMGHSTQANSVVLVEKSDGTDIFNMLNDGIYHAEFAENANPPACAAGNYNLFTSNSTNIMRVCNNGVRGDIPSSLAGSATLDFSDPAASSCSTDLTITVTGAADGDVVSLGVPNGAVVAGGQFTAWASAGNTVTVRHCCVTSADCADPASGTFKVRVDKP